MKQISVVVAVVSAALAGGALFAFAGPPGPGAPLSMPASTAGTQVFEGFCEASAILPWKGGFLVGDNETDGSLYGLTGTLGATEGLQLSGEVEDIEALAIGPAGELIVVGSQGANKKGKAQPERERILVQGHPAIRPDLSGCPSCIAARGLPPKEGGLSVEGAAWWGDALWLGVRSPLVGGEAMLLRLEGAPTVSLSVADTDLLDLGGYGVRDLMVTPEGLYVLAGPTDGRNAAHRLYRVSHPGSPPELVPIELPAGSEGLVRVGSELIVVIDGDGKPGVPCKEPARWARVPMAGAQNSL
ncbi:MAG: DUF3616 domain-containing protein [Myxococcota bacterium]